MFSSGRPPWYWLQICISNLNGMAVKQKIFLSQMMKKIYRYILNIAPDGIVKTRITERISLYLEVFGDSWKRVGQEK